ncbi:MAG: type I glyceraldehyde-3-phosphate dehydrogenase [Holosporaceae bacterium]|jgi:glyceraldehyde 3-phosphate dehydrogenase|nr:type I glyceraldehyde-3-phosphate dehydrogenase [Holosporaceae bacterium]
MKKVAINGFGRIGRLIFRAFFESGNNHDYEIVTINDLQSMDMAMHLLRYDSVHGKFHGEITKISPNEFLVNGNRISYFSEEYPTALSWNDIDLVFECTGVFKSRKSCQMHLAAGAKRVLISSPADDDVDRTAVLGVNCDTLRPSDTIISNASCTTNCLAPIVKAIHEEIGILNGFVTTIHSYTGDQRLVDADHSDFRRSRAAALNMIPTSTGATKAIELIFPELKGKLSGLSIRVSTPNVSLVDCTFTLVKNVSVDDIHNAIVKYSCEKLPNILGYTEEKLVSSDFNHCSLSAVVDFSLTQVISGNFAHVVAWYDNEWGFANRMLDMAKKILEYPSPPVIKPTSQRDGVYGMY